MRTIALLVTLLCIATACYAESEDYYANPNSPGYTQPYWGCLCENCNKMFKVSSVQLYGAKVTPNIEPANLGLKKGMSEDQVRSVLGFTWNGEYTDYKGLYYQKYEWRYPNGIIVYLTRKKGFWNDYELETWTGPVKVEQDPNAPQDTSCPYCGRLQNMRIAANRWSYAAQQQVRDDAQAQENIASFVIGTALGIAANAALSANERAPAPNPMIFAPQQTQAVSQNTITPLQTANYYQSSASRASYQYTPLAPPSSIRPSTSGTVIRSGNALYDSNGTTYRQSGNTLYGSNGTNYIRSGDAVYGSNGVTYRQSGNRLYGSNGVNYTVSGNTVYGSDGSTAIQSGDTTYYNRK